MAAVAAAPDDNGRVADLYRQCGPVVYRRCLRILKNPDAARDATQDVFVKLVRRIATMEDPETVLPWLYRVATNYCLNLRRTGRSRGEDTTVDLDVSPMTSPDLYPDRLLAQTILARFDAATQAIAVGVIVDGMLHDELAEALGVSRRTIYRKLDRFLKDARRHLAESAAGDRPARVAGDITRAMP
jgi:RNA polymerase sigma-70 factor (ECF subfamily)